MSVRAGLACLLLGLGWVAGAGAQEPEVPAAGLQAEAAGDWDRAVEIYSQAAAEAGRADLWVRVSRIEATRDHPREALAAIERALALEPDDVDHLRARAELASWAGDYDAADESWRRVGEQTGEPLATLQRARIAAWRGRIAPAVEHYHAYLRSVPDDSVATIELVRQETWRGNAREALSLLDGYRERFGETVDWRIERARALATGGRPRAAADSLAPLVAERPEDYEARLVLALAESDAQRSTAAVASTEALVALDAANPRTTEVQAYVSAPLRSAVRPRFEVYDDSDEVRHLLYGLEGRAALSPRARLVGEATVTDVRSEPGTALAPLDGDETVREAGGDAGVAIGLEGAGELEARIGGLHVDDAEETLLTWLASARLTPTDAVGIFVAGRRDFLDVSARSLDLGIRRTAGRASVAVSPAIGWTIEGGAAREAYSDDNGSWEARASTMVGVLRRQLVNVDVGAASRLLWFDEDLDNGYYDPEWYRQHLGIVSTYWKLDPQAGLSVRGAVGAFEDDAVDSWERSLEAAAEATIGITTDWTFVARAAYLDNVRSVTGAFHAFGAGFYLTRRF